MSEKFCIFCGDKPKDKNMEHVIPQWLIKMTGREKKDVFSFAPESEKHFSFMNYKFPACTECNTKYSQLEAEVKPILETVLNGGSISGIQASLLLDWFDKIRVGLWLTEMCYKPDLKQCVQPHFFIDSRVGKSDRMLSIQKVQVDKTGERGICWGGTDTVHFNFCPSAFVMLINDYYFFNASNTCLVSQRLGFPSIVATKVADADNGILFGNMAHGRHKICNPVITGFMPQKDSVTFYQPMYKDFMTCPTYLKDAYVIEHSYDQAQGKGGVFVQKGNVNNIRYLLPDQKVGLKMNAVPMPNMPVDTLKFQEAIAKHALAESDMMKFGSMLGQQMLQSMKSYTK